MTAASSPPPRDGEVCQTPGCGHRRDQHWDDADGACIVGDPDLPWDCDCSGFRPAAPSEPPAADSPTPETETCRICGLHQREHPGGDLHGSINGPRHAFAPSPVGTTEPPAETQQDDARPDSLTVWRRGYRAGVRDARERIRLGHDEPVALAARPSADTETLRAKVEALAADEDSHAEADPAWEISIIVPLAAGDAWHEQLFDAIADLAHDSQPEERTWDVFVSSTKQPRVVPVHLLRAALDAR